jgi:hypothetical protein
MFGVIWGCPMAAARDGQVRVRTRSLRLSQIEKAKDFAVRGLRALAGFAKKLKVT